MICILLNANVEGFRRRKEKLIARSDTPKKQTVYAKLEVGLVPELPYLKIYFKELTEEQGRRGERGTTYAQNMGVMELYQVLEKT